MESENLPVPQIDLSVASRPQHYIPAPEPQNNTADTAPTAAQRGIIHKLKGKLQRRRKCDPDCVFNHTDELLKQYKIENCKRFCKLLNGRKRKHRTCNRHLHDFKFYSRAKPIIKFHSYINSEAKRVLAALHQYEKDFNVTK